MINLFDSGYIKFIESWGRGEANEPEAAIIEAARQSTQGSFRGWERDEKLLKYMFENKHDSPFEFAGMTVEIQAPIMVFREWHRHRTQGFNEMSARYSPLPNNNYSPSIERLFIDVNGSNKQAKAIDSAQELTHEAALDWLEGLNSLYNTIEDFYQYGLKIGIPKELARLPIPVGRYSRMRATANLRNWLGFLTLRMSPKAQYEIRRYADIVGHTIIATEFPRTWKLFENTL